MLLYYIIMSRYVAVYAGLSGRAGAHGGAVVETLRYKPEGRGSIPDGVIGIFH
jgi:hypothetical protein